MNILLFDRAQSEFVQLAGILKEHGHQLHIATDERTAKTTFSRVAVQLALVTARSADNDIIGMMPEFRRLGDTHGTQIALMGKDLPDEFLTRAYNAGVDTEIRIPFSKPLLLARLAAADRASRRGAPAPEGTEHPQVAAPAAPAIETSPLEQSSQSQAWRSAANNIQSAASKFLTLPVSAGEAAAQRAPLAHACRIMLSNAQNQIECRIALGADARSARSLAIHMFGPEGEDLAPDMLSELANIFMGTMKTALSAESLPFTGGLPEALEPEHILRPTVTYKHQHAMDLTIGNARVVVHVGIRSKANLFVSATGLREGMVLAKDVFNARGLMVLNGGTRLSRNMIEQLEKFLPPKATVEVMAP